MKSDKNYKKINALKLKIAKYDVIFLEKLFFAL